MSDRYVTTIRTVLMFMLGMLDTSVNGAFVPVVVMLVMEMPVVHVIQMIVVGNRCMTAIRAMDMWVLVLHNKIMPQAWLLRRKGIPQFAFENLP